MAATEKTPAGQHGDIVKTYQLTLSKAVEGTPVLPNAATAFTLNWNFSTNKGQATLNSIDGTQTGIVLHPLGLSDKLAFMSDMKPTPYNIKGKEVIVSEVVLNLDRQGDNPSAAVRFNPHGSVIEATANW